MCKRERKKEIGRESEIDRESEREKERDRDRQSEIDRESEREKERKKDPEREKERECVSELFGSCHFLQIARSFIWFAEAEVPRSQILLFLRFALPHQSFVQLLHSFASSACAFAHSVRLLVVCVCRSHPSFDRS